MATETHIGWCDHTMNFWMGCDRVSPECDNCYIENILKRMGLEPFGGPIRTKNWTGPFKWNRWATALDERRRVFTCSLSDFFHRGADPWREDAWNVIRETPALDWLILTKRPHRIERCLPANWGDGYRNVWLGVTVGCNTSKWRLNHLKEVPSAVKFVSAEPLLEPLDFTPYLPWLDWIITGCEQAAKGKRRPMELHWVRDIDRQCREFGKAHFFKQYYALDRGRPVTDGLLDGIFRQDWPTPSATWHDSSADSLLQVTTDGHLHVVS